MTPPWTPKPFPKDGDNNIESTYAAKGRAVSAWEEVEVALSELYAVLIERSRHDPIAAKEYGEPANFRDRLAGLQRSAEACFQRHCDQMVEGRFKALIRILRRYATFRNEITHSHVQNATNYREHTITEHGEKWTFRYHFFLVPSRYTSRKFDENEQPEFIYTSVEMKEFAEALQDLRFMTEMFAVEVEGFLARSTRRPKQT